MALLAIPIQLVWGENEEGCLPQVPQVISMCGQRETVFVPPGEQTAGFVTAGFVTTRSAGAPNLSKACTAGEGGAGV